MRGAKQRRAKRRKSREKQARLQRNKVPEPVPESGQRGSAWVPGQCKGRGCELLWTKASEWVIVKGLDAETVASPGMAMAGRKQKRWPTKKLNLRPAAEPVARDGWLPVKLLQYNSMNSVRPAPSASGGHRLNCHRPGPFRWTAAPSPAIQRGWRHRCVRGQRA